MEYDGEVFEASPRSRRSKRPCGSDSEQSESEQTRKFGPNTFEGVVDWAAQTCEDMQRGSKSRA